MSTAATTTARPHVELEDLLQRVVEGTSHVIGEDYFRLLVTNLASAIQIRFTFVSELCNPEGTRLRILAICDGKRLLNNFEYDTEGTPCRDVIRNGPLYIHEGVASRFPRDRWLRDAKIQSYLAIPLRDHQDRPLGHLGMAHDQPLPPDFPIELALKIFAARASAELQRNRAVRELHIAHDQLEGRVRRRTEALQKSNELLRIEIQKRKHAVKAQRVVQVNLRRQAKLLEDKNVALREIFLQIDRDKEHLKDDIMTNVERIITPNLEKLRLRGAPEPLIGVLQRDLQSLTHSFGRRITHHEAQLTPREIEICNMVKNGLTNKEISQLLPLALHTVEKHRANARRKLGLARSGANFCSYLRSLSA